MQGLFPGAIDKIIRGIPEDKMRQSPWYEFLTSPEATGIMQQGFPGLYAEYERISREGLLSPGEMQANVGRFRQTLEPQVSVARTRAASDVTRRLGPGRGGSGAASAAIFNKVDVPTMRFVSDYANQLYQRNLASRQFGLQGQTGMLSGLMGAEAGLTDMEKQIYMFIEQLNLQKKYLEEMSKFGFGDILELGARGLAAYGTGGASEAARVATSVSRPYGTV